MAPLRISKSKHTRIEIRDLPRNERNLAAKRLSLRLLTLASIALVTYFLQKGYERDGLFWMLVTEFAIYAVFLIVFLSRQTGRLKSGPEIDGVSYEQLADQDSSVRAYIGLYLFIVMIAIVARVILAGAIEEVWMGPWGLFMVIAPIFVIVIWRQYKLEATPERS